ncbi:MAG: flagellar brake protein [Pseudomonadales bacterium]|nr:flagellar brake protein [Pseudomonadales bacterium]
MKRLTDLFNLNGKMKWGAMAMLGASGNASSTVAGAKIVREYGSKPKTEQPEIRQKDYLALFQLMRDHRMLKLKVRGDNHIYQTVLLEVNADEGYLVIDEPFPADGVLSGNFRQDVVLEYEREGFSTIIRSVVEMRIEEDGDKYFRLAWPQVEEVQRRDQFRLDVSGSWVDDIVISGVDGQQVISVLDLSATGVRVAFAGNQVESIYAGTYLSNLTLQLSGCDPMRFNIDITHCHYVPDAELGGIQSTIAGGRFVGLSYREKQAIQRFIFSAQRSERRDQLEQAEIAA